MNKTEENNIGFVGTTFVTSKSEESSPALFKQHLQTLTEQSKAKKFYCFQRWSHKVSGFVDISDLLNKDKALSISPEGQIFSQSWELRWKQRGDNYELLLLSSHPEATAGFDGLGAEWYWCDRPAKLYPKTETRFPKSFIYPTQDKALDISQRYFIDKNTATVHFVALTFSQ